MCGQSTKIHNMKWSTVGTLLTGVQPPVCKEVSIREKEMHPAHELQSSLRWRDTYGLPIWYKSLFLENLSVGIVFHDRTNGRMPTGTDSYAPHGIPSRKVKLASWHPKSYCHLYPTGKREKRFPSRTYCTACTGIPACG